MRALLPNGAVLPVGSLWGQAYRSKLTVDRVIHACLDHHAPQIREEARAREEAKAKEEDGGREEEMAKEEDGGREEEMAEGGEGRGAAAAGYMFAMLRTTANPVVRIIRQVA